MGRRSISFLELKAEEQIALQQHMHITSKLWLWRKPTHLHSSKASIQPWYDDQKFVSYELLVQGRHIDWEYMLYALYIFWKAVFVQPNLSYMMVEIGTVSNGLGARNLKSYRHLNVKKPSHLLHSTTKANP